MTIQCSRAWLNMKNCKWESSSLSRKKNNNLKEISNPYDNHHFSHGDINWDPSPNTMVFTLKGHALKTQYPTNTSMVWKVSSFNIALIWVLGMCVEKSIQTDSPTKGKQMGWRELFCQQHEIWKLCFTSFISISSTLQFKIHLVCGWKYVKNISGLRKSLGKSSRNFSLFLPSHSHPFQSPN
jgi:hypothetical protein